MDLSEIQVAYDHWLRQRDLKPETYRTYRLRVRRFCRFAESNTAPPYNMAILGECATEYINVCRRNNFSPSSINAAITVLNDLFEFLQFNQVSFNRETINERELHILESDVLAALIERAKKDFPPRDSAVLCLFLNTGIKLLECRMLDLRDVVGVDASPPFIYVRSRPSECRRVAIDTYVAEACIKYLANRAVTNPGDQDADALFLTRSGKRISSAGLDNLIRRLGWQSRMVLNHRLIRDSVIAGRLAQERDIYALAKFAGHCNLESTKRYVALQGYLSPPTPQL
jgi:integrase/recombinase XerC